MPGGQVGWNDLTGRVGEDLPIRRSYKPAGAMPLAFDKTDAGIDVGKRASCWSFKFEGDDGFKWWPKWATGGYDKWFESFLGTVPLDHTLLAVPHHEPDGGHGLPADGHPQDFIAGFARFRPIVDRVNAARLADGGTKILLGPILMRASLVWSPWDIDEWCPPADQVDFYGIDGYSEKYPSLSWSDLFNPVFAWAALRHRPIVVGETGPWDYPTGGREQWVLQAVADAKIKCADGSLLAWMYWNEDQQALVTDGECRALAS